jgi:predicted membrane protein
MSEASAASEEPEPVRGRLLVLVAVLNGALAMTWVGAFDNGQPLVWVYLALVALVALPLVMRSRRSFLVTCLIVAALLLVLGVLLYFFALFSFWPSAVLLLLAVTPLARRRPKRVAFLLAVLVAVPWGDAIWVSHLSHLV